ncbi:DUF4160 domain-containing protein [Azovibrio sp.]|uniref:DUF4160 domain-containing protein n=1 Tax=Azovibrio sp. TaxID=1872673 RepID=UPI003C707E8D
MPTISMFFGIREGNLPKRQIQLVQAWIERYHDELMADGYLASTGQTLFKMDSLHCGGWPSESSSLCRCPTTSSRPSFGEGKCIDLICARILVFLRSPPRKDSSLFMRAHVEHGTVVWSEDIDLSPDTLYRRGLPA